MSKRSFRPAPTRSPADYPREQEGRRSFLRQVLAAAAGGAMLSVLGACGDRPVEADVTPPLPDMGGAPPMDGPLDIAIRTDVSPPFPDITGGMPDATPAALDGEPPDGLDLPLDGGPLSD